MTTPDSAALVASERAIDAAFDAMASLGHDSCPKRPGVPQSSCTYCLATAAVQGIAAAGLLTQGADRG